MAELVDELITKLALKNVNFEKGNRKTLDKWIRSSEFVKRRRALWYDCAPNQEKSSVVACMTEQRPKFSKDPSLMKTKALRTMIIGWLAAIGILSVQQLRSLDAKQVEKHAKKYKWETVLHPCKVLEDMGEEASEDKKGGMLRSEASLTKVVLLLTL